MAAASRVSRLRSGTVRQHAEASGSGQQYRTSAHQRAERKAAETRKRKVKAARKLLEDELAERDHLRREVKLLKKQLKRATRARDKAQELLRTSTAHTGASHAPPPPPVPERPSLEFKDEDGFYSAGTKDAILALLIDARVPEHRVVQVIVIVAKLLGASIGQLPNARRAAETALSEAAEAEELKLAAWLAQKCGWNARISGDRPVATPPTRANILMHGRALR